MNTTQYAAFLADVRDELAANEAARAAEAAAREAHIAALVARADFGAWASECERMES